MPDTWAAYGEQQAGRRVKNAGSVGSGLQVLTPVELLSQPPREYLFKGVMSRGELSVWWGQPKCGKSFLLMHIAYALSQGRSVFGRRVHPIRVLYLACEGRSGLRSRIEALIERYETSVDFLIIAQPIDLWSEGITTDALIAIVKQERIGLLVVDTLNRVMAGGDENSSADMGALRTNLDRIRTETDVHIAVIHHGTKSGTGGPRGHGSLSGAADAIIEIAVLADGSRAVILGDAKDDASGDSLIFNLQVIELGKDVDGDPRTTCVIDELEVRDQEPHGKKVHLTNNAKVALRTLHDVVIEHGKPLPFGSGFPAIPITGVGVEQWRAAVYDKLSGIKPNSRRTAFGRALTELLASSQMGSHLDWVWPCWPI